MTYEKELIYQEYVQRENKIFHAPYDPELSFYSAIKEGNLALVTELCKEPLTDKKGLGKLSDNPLQNLKYHFAITAALVARYCIEGGMELPQAYGLSDFYIRKADSMKRIEDVSALHPVMCLDYTKRMRQMKKNSICSKPIALCIDYIYDHLHQKITVSILAEQVGLSESYLSRLFKKEMKISISRYILMKKIDTAKNMLAYSDYPISDISATLAFSSQSHFTELFRKHTGMTPMQYRVSGNRSL
jgi:AraC family transcriptional regulator